MNKGYKTNCKFKTSDGVFDAINLRRLDALKTKDMWITAQIRVMIKNKTYGKHVKKREIYIITIFTRQSKYSTKIKKYIFTHINDLDWPREFLSIGRVNDQLKELNIDDYRLIDDSLFKIKSFKKTREALKQPERSERRARMKKLVDSKSQSQQSARS